MPQRLKFRLEVTIEDSGVISRADLRVRDDNTRESKSLGGWPVIPRPGGLERLLNAIRSEIVTHQAAAPGRKNAE